MSSLAPRVVLVTRQTELSALLARHGTRGQVGFYLSARGQTVEAVEARHTLQETAIATAKAAIPAEWTFAQVERADLNRFLFFPNDIVVALGQDGLVANLAKYLADQLVIGVTPDPELGEGVLTPHRLSALPDLLRRTAAKDVEADLRTMVAADLAGGDSLLAMNELFIGHRSHQSARYDLSFGDTTEFQSSSGIIVSTGTGLTGWARSIMAATGIAHSFAATEPTAAFFTREPWPSRHSTATLRTGEITANETLSVTSRQNEGGVIFADGIEQDFLCFDWGATATIHVAEKRLRAIRT
ncbi:MAG: hypothetical protein AAGA87_16305 [Pseudomonadota bacterium]